MPFWIHSLCVPGGKTIEAWLLALSTMCVWTASRCLYWTKRFAWSDMQTTMNRADLQPLLARHRELDYGHPLKTSQHQNSHSDSETTQSVSEIVVFSCRSGPQVPAHLDVVRRDLDLNLNHEVFRSAMMQPTPTGRSSLSNVQIFDVLEAAGQRPTTRADNEWTVLASTLNIDTTSVLLYRGEERA